MKKSFKVLAVSFILQIIVSGCTVDTFDMYKESMHEDWQDTNTRKIQGGENDVNDLRGCSVLMELGRWEFDKKWQDWDRRNVWQVGALNYYKTFGLYEKGDDQLSNKILSNKLLYPVYIGPWHPITLTRTEGSFFSKKEIKEAKIIRFFAYTGRGGGEIMYQYESQTEENKNIKEKPFSLPSSDTAPKKFDLCAVKWIAKFGYNAIYDQKTKKIIQVKE